MKIPDSKVLVWDMGFVGWIGWMGGVENKYKLNKFSPEIEGLFSGSDLDLSY